MNQTNFLIGRGHLLTHDIDPPKRKPSKKEAYSLAEAVERLAPEFEATAAALDELPKEACPADLGAGRLMINPSYIARSFFPASMLRSVGLESVGSRTVKVTPAKWTKKDAPRPCTTTELFVVGKREAFRNLDSWANQVTEGSDEAIDLAHIEHFSALTARDRIISHGAASETYFEIGLHLLPDENRAFVQQSFVSYAAKVGARLYVDLGFTAGTCGLLCHSRRAD